MSKKNVSSVDLNQWVMDYSKYLADESMKILESHGDDKGPEVFRALSLAFVSHMITMSVFSALNERPEGVDDEEKLYEYSKKIFSEVKQGFQEGVAAAFTRAMSHYSGRDMEYYCQIKLVPEMPTKQVN